MAKADAHAAAYFALAASHHHDNARRAMVKLESERKKEQAYKDHLSMQDRPTVYVVEPNDAMLRKNGSMASIDSLRPVVVDGHKGLSRGEKLEYLQMGMILSALMIAAVVVFAMNVSAIGDKYGARDWHESWVYFVEHMMGKDPRMVKQAYN